MREGRKGGDSTKIRGDNWGTEIIGEQKNWVIIDWNRSYNWHKEVNLTGLYPDRSKIERLRKA